MPSYNLVIYCEDCTIERKKVERYYTERFYSLNDAVKHILETNHEVKIELEPVYDED